MQLVDFGIIYLNHLPHGHLQKTLPPWQFKDSLFEDRSLCPDIPGQLWAKQEQLAVPDAALIHHPPNLRSEEPEAREAFTRNKAQGWKALGSGFWKKWGRFKPHANYSRVEVTHCVSQLAMRAEQNSSWMYAVRGSGVFYDVGRTIAFDRHRDAVDHFIPKNDCKGECWNAFNDLMKAAYAQGWDSLQFTAHGDQRCGLAQMEIVDVKGYGAQSCSSQFSAGWGGAKPCACVVHSKCANCYQSIAEHLGAGGANGAALFAPAPLDIVTTYPTGYNASRVSSLMSNVTTEVALTDMQKAFSRRWREHEQFENQDAAEARIERRRRNKRRRRDNRKETPFQRSFESRQDKHKRLVDNFEKTHHLKHGRRRSAHAVTLLGQPGVAGDSYAGEAAHQFTLKNS